MSRLRAIFFDIDDTLYSTSDFAALARRNSIRAMIAAGLRMDETGCLNELHEVIGEFSSNYENHFDKLLLRLPPQSYSGVNAAALVASAVVAYHETKVRHLTAFEDAVDVIRRLAATDLVSGIISAGRTIKQFEKLVRLKMLPYLTPHAIFISEQIGISKPNPKLYLRACEGAGCEPRDAIYVGNSPINDIDPAKRLGMITVLSRRGGRYASEAGQTVPDFQIDNFWDLQDILRDRFEINLPGRSGS